MSIELPPLPKVQPVLMDDMELGIIPNEFKEYRAAVEARERILMARIAELEAELERERMRLAACGVVAMANTPESAARARDMHPDYRSASCDDVARAVDAEMAMRAERDAARADAERLDAGCIQFETRDELGHPIIVRYSGVDLRAAIDAARGAE